MKIREGKNVERVWLKHYEDLVSKEIDNPDLLLTDYLETMAKKYPDSTSTIFMGAKLTYQQLNSLADAFAVALSKMGVNKGDRVAIHLPNCPQFVIAYYGILKIGGVLVRKRQILHTSRLILSHEILCSSEFVREDLL